MMSKCKFCDNEKAHEKGKHCKSCNFAYMSGRAEALTKAKSLVREIQLQAWEQERQRILDAVEKMRPYIDENGVNWYAPFNNIIKAIKGENK